MTKYENLNCISQGILYIKSLLTEVGGTPLISVNSELIYWFLWETQFTVSYIVISDKISEQSKVRKYCNKGYNQSPFLALVAPYIVKSGSLTLWLSWLVKIQCTSKLYSNIIFLVPGENWIRTIGVGACRTCEGT